MIDVFEHEDEDAPSATLVQLCLEEAMDMLTEQAHLMSRSHLKGTSVPRIFTFISDNQTSWETYEVEAGLIEMMPNGVEGLMQRLKAANKHAKYTVRVWLYVLPGSGKGAKSKPSGQYIMMAGGSDGSFMSMVFVGEHWDGGSRSTKFVESFQATYKERFGHPMDDVHQHVRTMLESAQTVGLETTGDKLVEYFIDLYEGYLRSMALQSSNLIAVAKADAELGVTQTMEDLQRQLKASENSRAGLQKDFEKLQGMQQSLQEQQARTEEEVRRLRVTVPRSFSNLNALADRSIPERLDQLF